MKVENIKPIPKKIIELIKRKDKQEYDKPNGNNHITFDQFLEKASKRCAIIIKKFLI